MARPRLPRAEPLVSPDGASIGVPLTQGKFAWIDAADWSAMSAHNWCAVRRPNGRWYAYRGLGKAEAGTTVLIAMHTQLTGWAEVDHKSRDGLDNRRENLREATRSQNNGNRITRGGRTSSLKGVQQRTNGTWIANCCKRHLGTFKTEREAGLAYDRAARGEFGEFARLNFPEES